MSTVWLMANTVCYPEGGGHFWVYLNWALGLRAAGCRVVWVETVSDGSALEAVRDYVPGLRRRLSRFGFDEVVVCTATLAAVPADDESATLLRQHGEADLLLDIRYCPSDDFVGRFRRSAMIDIDPGLCQLWISAGTMPVARHDIYFTTGETVGTPAALFPDCGLSWTYTPPCVAVDAWPTTDAPSDGAYTTVSHWEANEWVESDGEIYDNSKRSGFLPFLDLPRMSGVRLELALCLRPEDREWEVLEKRGWSVREAVSVSGTPEAYRAYIQSSRGEFSCVKPSCRRLQNAWISDRTLCYLATGRPAVAQHTGPSRILPDAEGLLRFRTAEEAAELLAEAEKNHRRHSRSARDLVHAHFDARKVATCLLEAAFAAPAARRSPRRAVQHPSPPEVN